MEVIGVFFRSYWTLNGMPFFKIKKKRAFHCYSFIDCSSFPFREFLAYNDSNKPLADTDLDKISEARSMNIIKQDEQLKGDEDENSSDCTKQPVNSQNGLSTDTNEVEGEREVGSEQVSDSNSRQTQMVLKLILTLPA